MKRKGIIRLTHEFLGITLGVNPDSILHIDTDNRKDVIFITHSDENQQCFDVAELQECPVGTFYDSGMIDSAKRLLEINGYEVSEKDSD